MAKQTANNVSTNPDEVVCRVIFSHKSGDTLGQTGVRLMAEHIDDDYHKTHPKPAKKIIACAYMIDESGFDYTYRYVPIKSEEFLALHQQVAEIMGRVEALGLTGNMIASTGDIILLLSDYVPAEKVKEWEAAIYGVDISYCDRGQAKAKK